MMLTSDMVLAWDAGMINHTDVHEEVIDLIA